MGEGRRNREGVIGADAVCIFCGGNTPATTVEHCPPRSLFADRQWPEGFAFPACQSCNGGSSDDDLMVAFLAQLNPNADPKRFGKGVGLMKLVHRQFPGALQQMYGMSNVEARAEARRLGMKPAPGRTYRQLGIVNIPDAMHSAVATLGSKLTKAIYSKQTLKVFPVDGAIMFQWFTNAQVLEHGRIVVLEAMRGILGTSEPLRRTGRDLRDQFDYYFSADQDGTLYVLQVIFGEVFGFVTIFSPVPGKLEGIEARLNEQHGVEAGPFDWLQRTAPG